MALAGVIIVTLIMILMVDAIFDFATVSHRTHIDPIVLLRNIDEVR